MRISDWSSVVCSSDLPAKPMKGMGRIQHLFTICSFWANANPSGKPHGSCEQCVRTLKVAVIYVVEEADSLFRRGGRDLGESSEARRVGKEWVRTCRSRWCPED